MSKNITVDLHRMFPLWHKNIGDWRNPTPIQEQGIHPRNSVVGGMNTGTEIIFSFGFGVVEFQKSFFRFSF